MEKWAVEHDRYEILQESFREAGTEIWGQMKWSSLIKLLISPWSAQVGAEMWVHLPNKLGLGNLHDSLYVEYWGWEYGLPEKSPPERKHKTRNTIFRERPQRIKIMLTLCLDALFGFSSDMLRFVSPVKLQVNWFSTLVQCDWTGDQSETTPVLPKQWMIA